jgi:hypothetical protein
MMAESLRRVKGNRRRDQRAAISVQCVRSNLLPIPGYRASKFANDVPPECCRQVLRQRNVKSADERVSRFIPFGAEA